MQEQHLEQEILAMGVSRRTGGNHPIPLDPAEQVWYLLRGHAEVFSVSPGNGNHEGARSWFFTAGQGELMFGISDRDREDAYRLVAVPSPDAEIVWFSLAKLRELIAVPEFTGVVASLTDTWISRLSAGISRDINPRTDCVIEAGTLKTVSAGLKLRAKKGVAWIEFLSGKALFLGMKETEGPDGGSLFPVTQDSWLQTIGTSEVRARNTRELCQREDFWKHLENFYRVLLYCEGVNLRLNRVDAYNRLNEKARHASGTWSAALARIASVLSSNIDTIYTERGRDDLLAACRLVAAYAGIKVVAPGKSGSGEPVPLTLDDILHASRFRARKVKLQDNWYEKDNGPLLAFTRESEMAVALIPKSPGKYEFICPAKQTRQAADCQAAALLQPEAWLFYRPLPDQPVNGRQLLRFGLRHSVRDIVTVALAGLAGGLLSLLLPILTGTIFDTAIPQSDHRQLYVLSLVIFLSALAIVLFQLVRSFAMIRIETRLDFVLQSALWDRLLNLPVSFFKKYPAGELASKANSIMKLRKILSDSVIYSLLSGVFMSVSLFLVFLYDFRLASGVLIFLLISLLVITGIGKRMERRQRKVIHLQNRTFGMVIQLLSSISKIRIAGAEVHAFSKWAETYAESKRQSYESGKLFLVVNMMTSLMPLLILLFVFGMLSAGLSGTMSTGRFMAFYTALTMTVVSFFQLGMAGLNYFMAIPLLDSIRPILETVPESVAIKAEIGELKGGIEADSLNFRYQPDGPLVLENVSLRVQPGEFAAIVGPSGSGKSTLLRLLLGFEIPESGSVCYDGQNLASFDPASIRRQTGTVLQHSGLYEGTILSNITGMTGATYDEAWEAAREVSLDEDIRQMPMGMHTVITGGLSTLSAGQRQRIMIARAIAGKPRILFFDEATSALDNKTQQIVSESLERLQATRLVIAHRLSTVQHADRIFLLDQGRIVEEGTYTELLHKGGKFCELVSRQLPDLEPPTAD